MRERRGILIHPEELEPSWYERLSQARINTLGLHPAGGKKAPVTLENAIRRHTLPSVQDAIRCLNRQGIEVEYEAHVMGWLLPRDLFSLVPDWFRMNEAGERVADYNLCPSNADALEYIAGRSAILAQLLHTGSDRYFYWLDDVAGGYICHCPKCRGLAASDQQMRVVNAMLKGIRRWNSQAKLCYLAYLDTIDAPQHSEPLPGVFLEYAPIHRDSHARLFDPDNAQNAAEAAPLPMLLERFGKKDSQVLEYWVDNSRFSNWQKPPVRLTLEEEIMRDDVRNYRALGFESITSFGCFLGEDYRALWGEPPVQAYGDILYR